METIKVGKRGTIVLPVKLRKQLGFEEGTLILAEAKDGGLSLRPAVAVEVEVYTPERKAEFLINAACTREEFDWAMAEVRSWGLDPLTVKWADTGKRDSLPTDAEFEAKFKGREGVPTREPGAPKQERHSAA